MTEIFRKLSNKVSQSTGNPAVFVGAVMIVGTWLLTGPLFHFSNTWQLFINTFTTITTFLMVFLIQNTQNRDAKAIHIKLDELLGAMKGARNQLMGAEDLSEKELDDLLVEFQQIREKYVKVIERKGGMVGKAKLNRK